MTESRSFTYYQDKAIKKIKIESSALFNVFANDVCFGRLATFLIYQGHNS